MSNAREQIEEQALDWIIRLREPGFDEWEAFEDWLAEAPAHAEIYHAMACADEDAAALLATEPPIAPAITESDERPRRSSRRVVGGWLGGALAASILGFSSYALLRPSASIYAVETAAGMHRSIILRDGTRIDLNGGTRLELDREDERMARLDHGEATFTVVHDDAHPFTVTTGDATLVDAGTLFNVSRDRGVTAVAVAEGAVVYNPEGEAVKLLPGKTLRAVDGEGGISVGEIDPAGVGSWREGRLVYDGAPLALVAADIARSLGVPVSAASGVAKRPFHGVIMLDRDDDRAVEQLEGLLDVEARRLQRGWILTARNQ